MYKVGQEHLLPGSFHAEGYRCFLAHAPGSAIATLNHRGRVVGHVEVSRDGSLREHWQHGQEPRVGLKDAAVMLLRGHTTGQHVEDGWNHPTRAKLAKGLTTLKAPSEAPAPGIAPPPGIKPPAHEGGIAGAHITKSCATYEHACKMSPKGSVTGACKNLWVRQNAQTGHNADRTLMVQFSSDLLQGNRTRDTSDDYYDKLYSQREGYHRADDFWELPQWQAHMANSLPNTDHYTVRDPKEAAEFMKSAGYKNVCFSALDVNKDFVKSVAQNYGGKVVVGGYTDMSHFADTPNVQVHPTIQSFVESEGQQYKPGYDYRHFQGTKTIPRLTLSDGCRHQCTFCSVPKQVVEKPREEILQQVDAFAKHLPADLVYLNDKTFGQADNHAMLPEIYERIKAQNPKFKGFVVQTTAAQMKKLSPDFLKKSGIRHIELGIESVNDDILRAHKKPANEALIEEAANKCRDAKVNLIPNIMVGLPGETKETYGKTMGWLKKHSDIISHVNAYNLALYDQSELGQKLNAISDADRDENQTIKSWHTDPEVHRQFHRDLFDYGKLQLDRQPFADDSATAGLLKAGDDVWWHGTPSGDLRGGRSGLHVGTRLAAEQALHARIGHPAEGQWDGTREYGKTKLAGRKTLAARYPGQGWDTGFNGGLPEEDHLPDPKSLPVFSDGTPMSLTHRPEIFPLRITGPMTNTPRTPHEDFKANGYMAAQLKRGTAKRGFYYTNQGEDAGSISATVPGPNHVVKLLREQASGTVKKSSDDRQHEQALQQTGFWGKQGAGAVIVARDTGRILLPHRSMDVQEPGTWGTWGGAIDGNEDPAVAAHREVKEECGYNGPVDMHHVWTFKHPSGFQYHNHIAYVDHEFVPNLNWETQAHAWVKPGEWPQPMHPGLASLVERPEFKKHFSAVSNHPKLSGLAALNKSIAAIQPGKLLGQATDGRQLWDYSHILHPHWAQQGVKLTLTTIPRTKEFTINVDTSSPDGEYRVGQTHGSWKLNNGAIGISPFDTEVHEDWRGKKFGMAMYEAMLAHGKHVLGATHVYGDVHSTSASHVHSALAKKHGLSYKRVPNLTSSPDGPWHYPDRHAWADTPDSDYDGKYAPYQYLIKGDHLPKQAVTVFVEDGRNNVLWGLRQKGGWTLPGGHVDKGESLADAAIREVWEECGLDLMFVREVGSAQTNDGTYVHVFRAVAKPGQPHSKNDPDCECSQWKWLSVMQGFPEAMSNLAHKPNVALELLGFPQ